MSDLPIGVVIRPEGDGDRRVRDSLTQIDRQYGRTQGRIDRGQKAMDQSFRRTATNADEVARSMNHIGVAAGRIVVQLAAMVGTVAGIRNLSQTISEFDTAMSGVEAVTGAVTSEMENMTETARTLGATTRFTAAQAAEGMRFLGMAGFETNEIVKAIPATLDLATAAQLDLGSAADITSNIMSAFNIEAERTVEIADALATVQASANTNVLQMGDGMKLVGPIARSMGISMQDTAAALGILANAGLQATMGGTGLRRVLSTLANPSKEAEKVIRGLGLTMEQVNPQTNSLKEIIERLSRTTLDGTKALAAFGDRGAPAITALTSQAGDLDKLTKAVNDGAGASKRMADIMNDNLEGDSLAMKSAFDELLLVMGDAGVRGELRKTTQGLTQFFRESGDGAETFGRVLGGMVAALREVGPTAAAAAAALTGLFIVRTLGNAINGLTLRLIEMNFAQRAAIAASADFVITGGKVAPVAGRMAGALGMLGGAFRLLGGPGGLILLAASAMLIFRDRTDETLPSVDNVTRRIRELRGEFEEITRAANATELTNVQKQLDTLTDSIEKAEDVVARTRGNLDAIGEPDPATADLRRILIADLERQGAELSQLLGKQSALTELEGVLANAIRQTSHETKAAIDLLDIEGAVAGTTAKELNKLADAHRRVAEEAAGIEAGLDPAAEAADDFAQQMAALRDAGYSPDELREIGTALAADVAQGAGDASEQIAALTSLMALSQTHGFDTEPLLAYADALAVEVSGGLDKAGKAQANFDAQIALLQELLGEGLISESAFTEAHQRLKAGFWDQITEDGKDAVDTLSDSFGGLADMIADTSIEGSRGIAVMLRGIQQMTDEQGSTTKGFAQMAAGASSFFDEGSSGYKILTAASQAFHAIEIAQTIQRTIAKGTEAIANQASGGDPYSAFARVAAMAALMAGFGIAVSGGGGGGGSATRRAFERQGSGTILGDATAESESISRSMDRLVSLQEEHLQISRGILAALRGVEASIDQVARFSVAEGSRAASEFFTQNTGFMQNIFEQFGQLGFGLQFDPSASVGGGRTGAEFFAEQTGRNNSIDRTISPLSPEFSASIDSAFRGMVNSVRTAAISLTGDADRIDQALSDITLETIGFTDIILGLSNSTSLSGGEIVRILSEGFSEAADNLVEALMPELVQFQQVGEGLSETLVRVSNTVGVVRGAFDDFGISLDGFDIIQIIGISEALADLSGGLEQLATNLQGFRENFFTDDEQQAMLGSDLRDQFAALGLELPATRDEFRLLIQQFDDMGDEGLQTLAILIGLQGNASKFYDFIENAEGRRLERLGFFYDAFGEESERAERRARAFADGLAAIGIMDVPATRDAFADLVKEAIANNDPALDDLLALLALANPFYADIERAEEQRLEDLQSEHDQLMALALASRRAADGIRGLIDDLLVSDVSPLSPMDRVDEGLRQFNDLAALALAGDVDAANDLQAVARDLLTNARDVFASGPRFQAIWDHVLSTLTDIASVLDVAANDANQAASDITSSAAGQADATLTDPTDTAAADVTVTGSDATAPASGGDAIVVNIDDTRTVDAINRVETAIRESAQVINIRIVTPSGDEIVNTALDTLLLRSEQGEIVIDANGINGTLTP